MQYEAAGFVVFFFFTILPDSGRKNKRKCACMYEHRLRAWVVYMAGVLYIYNFYRYSSM